MPTFHSIGIINPALRSRLVTQSSVVPSDATNSAAATTTTTTRTATVSYQTIDTPLALLVRHPNSLRLLDSSSNTCKVISRDQVTKLRRDVANALIARTLNGQHYAHVHRIIIVAAATPETPTVGDFSSSESATARQQLHTTQPVHSISGSVSAYAMLAYESLQHQHHHSISTLSTGSRAVDALFALPEEYQALSVSNEQQEERFKSLPVDQGVPIGYVTQFYGVSAVGKTQVALSVAARRNHRINTCSVTNNRFDSFPCWFIGQSALLHSFAKRLSQLCRNDPNIMTETIFLPVTNIYDVLAALSTVEEALLSPTSTTAEIEASSSSPHLPPIALIILDSLSTCLVHNNHASESYMTPLLHRLAITLKRLARSFHCAVILTNGSISFNRKRSSNDFQNDNAVGVFGSSTDVPVPTFAALGRIWESAVDIQVKVSDVEASRSKNRGRSSHLLRQAILERHPTTMIIPHDPVSMPIATFRIDPILGIVDYP